MILLRYFVNCSNEVHLNFFQLRITLNLGMKIVLAFLAVAWATPHPITTEEEWNDYKKSFGKFYTSEDENGRRLNAYLATKQAVEEHNRKYKRGETSFKMGINEFADWFPEELKKLNGLKFKEHERKVFELPSGVEVPKKINWVKKGAVTSVKNQGRCGSCYAFSAAGALEGLMYVTNKTITDLSPQELVDCSRMYGNNGCDGGWMNGCFSYVARKKGISTEEFYPYIGTDGICRAKNRHIGASCTGYRDLQDNEDALKRALGTISPVSIAFAVGNDFLRYKEGIYDGECFSVPNHGMLAVGYGRDKKTRKDYWLVKNSWGEAWGMGGYVKIIRGVNKCFISKHTSYPVYIKAN